MNLQVEELWTKNCELKLRTKNYLFLSENNHTPFSSLYSNQYLQKINLPLLIFYYQYQEEWGKPGNKPVIPFPEARY